MSAPLSATHHAAIGFVLFHISVTSVVAWNTCGGNQQHMEMDLVRELLDWESAERCQSFGGHLATVANVTQELYSQAALSVCRDLHCKEVHVGALNRNSNSTKQYRWVADLFLSMQEPSWQRGEPSGEACGSWKGVGLGLNAYPCSTQRFAVCQRLRVISGTLAI